MQHSTVLHAIRRSVGDTFAEFGDGDVSPIYETILIRDDFYCGRRFATKDMEAVWFIEENQVKFYSEDGTVVRVEDASQIVAKHAEAVIRKAA